MANPQSMWEMAARQIVKAQKDLAPKMAESMIPGPGTVKYQPADERNAFWQRNPQIPEGEAEQAVWRGFIDRLTQDYPDLGLEDAERIAAPYVAMAVYPARLPLVRQGDRKLSVRKQIDFSNRMEKLGPPVQEGEIDG